MSFILRSLWLFLNVHFSIYIKLLSLAENTCKYMKLKELTKLNKYVCVFFYVFWQIEDILKFGLDKLFANDDSSVENIDFTSILGATINGSWQIDSAAAAAIVEEDAKAIVSVKLYVCASVSSGAD